MDIIDVIFMAGFWCSAAGIFYTYLGYPVLLYGLSRAFGRAPTPPNVTDAQLSSVALLIVAHNEAAVIEQRLQNALACDYPRDRFEVVVASDGSDDGTNEICRRYENKVRMLEFPQRRGKPAALSAALTHLDSQIIVLSDANTSMNTAAVRRLARWFAQPDIGAVCGRLVLSDHLKAASADSLYWRYETFLKQCESRLNGLLGANGGIYAIRRELIAPLPPGTVVDDFVIPLSAKIRSGCRIVYDMDARADEETAPDLRGEFRRRTRIGVGGFQSLGILWPLLIQRHGWTSFTFWSHKVLRWFCPFLLIIALLTTLALNQHSLFRMLLLAQIVFYVLAFVGVVVPRAIPVSRPLRVLSYFVGMNLALLVGFTQWLRGQQAGIWEHTKRLEDCGPAA